MMHQRRCFNFMLHYCGQSVIFLHMQTYLDRAQKVNLLILLITIKQNQYSCHMARNFVIEGIDGFYPIPIDFEKIRVSFNGQGDTERDMLNYDIMMY